MSTWNVRPADESAVASISRTLGIHRAIARTLWLRGYENPQVVRDFLAARDDASFLAEPIATPGMEKAVHRIKKALDEGEKIAIYGDYDCDGITSTSLLYRYLKRGHQADITAHLPDRFKDGYGLNPNAVERLAKDGAKVILTCDNGISALDAARKAKELGIDLIVTDHHQPPDPLPDCYAIVHPQLEFPHLRDFSGVGVAYLLTIALEGGWTPRMDFLLDFVTVGTIADVVPLNGPNRSMVWKGLERLRHAKNLTPGLQALGEVSKVRFESISATDIGFRLGPRLNAAGRLESPDIGLHLLTTNDKQEAMQLAMRLDGINQERQRLNAEWNEKIVERIEKEWDLDNEPFIVLADPAYPHGIVGIIAGKLKDRYRSPILLFSGTENPNDPWKASGRSPEGFHLNEALTACQDLLVGFGGHAQSAGCSALYENLPALRKALNQRIRDLGWERPADVVWLDDELPFHEATETLLQELDVLEPFGQHNPMPVFGLLQAKVVGRKVRGNTLLLRVDDGRTIREVTAWGQADRADELDGWIRLSYGLRRSNYRNNALETIADKLEGIPAPPPIRVETKKTFATITDRREENRIEIEEGCAVYGWETLTDEEQEHLMDQQLTLLPLHEEVPDNLDRLVLVTPPFDEAHYQSMQRAAHRIMLFWKNREEANITPSLLQEGYRLLLERRERPLNEALGALESELGVPGLAVLRIFKEAGVVVEKGLEWHLLAPPDEEIPLERMKSYLEYRDAMPFRERALNQTNQKQPAAK